MSFIIVQKITVYVNISKVLSGIFTPRHQVQVYQIPVQRSRRFCKFHLKQDKTKDDRRCTFERRRATCRESGA